MGQNGFTQLQLREAEKKIFFAGYISAANKNKSCIIKKGEVL